VYLKFSVSVFLCVFFQAKLIEADFEGG